VRGRMYFSGRPEFHDAAVTARGCLAANKLQATWYRYVWGHHERKGLNE
jgi:hypothetical protein